MLSIADGLRAADDRLATYRREVKRAVTGRLQAYLALTSLGIPADLRLRSPGDVRLAGLSDLRPGERPLAEMRDGIRALIADTATTILGGASDDEVYATWRARTAERVADAKMRFEVPVAVPPTTIDVAGAIATTLDGALRSGPHAGLRRDEVADIVLAFDQNLLLPAAVLIESMAVHASGPLRLWVLGRGLPSSYAGGLRPRSHPCRSRSSRATTSPTGPAAVRGGSRPGSRSPRWTGCCCPTSSARSIASSTSTSTRCCSTTSAGWHGQTLEADRSPHATPR